MSAQTKRPIQILIVEDNPADLQLITLLLRECQIPHRVTALSDGEAATKHLFEKVKAGQAPWPELIILDLNLPRKDGREVLKEIKQTSDTAGIPTIILTTSHDEEDVRCCYELHANCYITKPSDLQRFNEVMKAIEQFWFGTVQLPKPRLVKA